MDRLRRSSRPLQAGITAEDRLWVKCRSLHEPNPTYYPHVRTALNNQPHLLLRGKRHKVSAQPARSHQPQFLANCILAIVNVHGKLKQIKRSILHCTTDRPLRLMADEEWGEYKKEDWVEEVGETKIAAFFDRAG